MDEPVRMQALGHGELRERLLNKRQAASVRVPCAYPPCGRLFTPENPRAKHCCPDHQAKASALKRKDAPVEKTCAYSKCRKPFISTRVDQVYHSADCRKRAWFERNFAPIAKEGK